MAEVQPARQVPGGRWVGCEPRESGDRRSVRIEEEADIGNGQVSEPSVSRYQLVNLKSNGRLLKSPLAPSMEQNATTVRSLLDDAGTPGQVIQPVGSNIERVDPDDGLGVGRMHHHDTALLLRRQARAVSLHVTAEIAVWVYEGEARPILFRCQSLHHQGHDRGLAGAAIAGNLDATGSHRIAPSSCGRQKADA